jgi:hypothetical protein
MTAPAGQSSQDLKSRKASFLLVENPQNAANPRELAPTRKNSLESRRFGPEIHEAWRGVAIPVGD